MEVLTIAAILLCGAVAGGVLNGCIDRLPKGENPFPRRCPDCGAKYGVSDFLMLSAVIGGKTKCACGHERSVREAAVELGNAVVWLLCYFVFSEASLAHLLIAMAAVSTYLCILCMVYDKAKVPDGLYLFLLALGIGDIFCTDSLKLSERFMGLFFGGAFFILCYALCFMLLKKEGLGWGDIKLMSVSGFLMGWQAAFMAIIFGTLTACVVLAVVSLRKGDDKKDYPFSVFISAGAIVAMLVGESLWWAYVGLFSL